MYLDTSVAVKLFVREPDSDECELVVGGDGFVTSELFVGEFWSALLAKERAKHFGPTVRPAVWSEFNSLVAEGIVQLVPLNGIVLREAIEVMGQVHPHVALRTLDAIHLATYLSVDAGPLFTRDQRMIDAARLLNLPLAR